MLVAYWQEEQKIMGKQKQQIEIIIVLCLLEGHIWDNWSCLWKVKKRWHNSTTLSQIKLRCCVKKENVVIYLCFLIYAQLKTVRRQCI